MYDVDRSGDTDNMAMRGSVGVFKISVLVAPVEGLTKRFISVKNCQNKWVPNRQHIAYDIKPLSGHQQVDRGLFEKGNNTVK